MNSVNYYKNALETEGFFEVEEADLLIETTKRLSDDSNILEIGSYYGRSTLFFLSGMSDSQRLLSLDTFVKRAGYTDSDHHYKDIFDKIVDSRHTLLPLDIRSAYEHLKEFKFELIFIDGDHSYIGSLTDLAYGISLSEKNSYVLCHDVNELFPGVVFATESLENSGVLEKVCKVKSLQLYKVLATPTWLIEPSVYREE